jgi:hypothetical protein
MHVIPQVFPLTRFPRFLYEAHSRGRFSPRRVDILPFASDPALRRLHHYPHYDRDHAIIWIRNDVRFHDSFRRRALSSIPSPLATFPRPPVLLRLVDDLLGQALAPAPSKDVCHLWRVPWILAGSRISKEAGKIGMLFGVFTASGLYHELTMYTMGGGFDKQISLFFVMQAAAALGERVWYKVTGRKVQGWTGLIWVYFCIMILGQPCSEHFLTTLLSVSPVYIDTDHELYYPSRRLAPPRTWRQRHRPNTRQSDQKYPLADPSKSSPHFRKFTLISSIIYPKQAAAHLAIASLSFVLEFLNVYPTSSSLVYPASILYSWSNKCR